VCVIQSDKSAAAEAAAAAVGRGTSGRGDRHLTRAGYIVNAARHDHGASWCFATTTACFWQHRGGWYWLPATTGTAAVCSGRPETGVLRVARVIHAMCGLQPGADDVKQTSLCRVSTRCLSAVLDFRCHTG